MKEKFLRQFSPASIEENSRAIMLNYLEKAEELYGQFAKNITPEKQPVISIYVTDLLQLDAFVAPHSANNHFLVGLSYGLFANLNACFMGLLSHPQVLPHIGDSQNTYCKYTITDYGLLDFTFEHDVIKEKTPVESGFPIWNYPKDEERVLYAILLFDIAIQFILYHEWGHILGGHLQYLNQQYHIDDLGEMENAGAMTMPSMEYVLNEPIRKAMEFEADYIAASMIASIPFELTRHKRSFFQAYPEDFLKKYDLRDAVFFSVLSLFHLFQEVRLKHKCNDGRLYPEPYYRFCSLLFGINKHEQDDAKKIWLGYDYRGVSEFAKVSQVLQFEFQFTEQVYNDQARRKEIIRLDDTLQALGKKLRSYRLTY